MNTLGSIYALIFANVHHMNIPRIHTFDAHQNNKNSARNDEYLESPLGSSNVSMESINESNMIEPPELNEVPLRKKNQFGGSLMSAMARSTYTLAPTATLLAAASSFMKTKKRKK